jgi:hypothetical protein
MKRYRADDLDLAIGPLDPTWKGITDREYESRMAGIEAQWRVEGPAMVEEWKHSRPGERPWAWWAFTARVQMPTWQEDEPVLLLELDAMDADEIEKVITRGTAVVADQEAARVGHASVPLEVVSAQAALKHLGRPLLDETSFPHPAWAERT